MAQLAIMEDATAEDTKLLLDFAIKHRIKLKVINPEEYEDYLFGEILKETDMTDTVDMTEIKEIFENARNSVEAVQEGS